jgi:hypothetical protein
MDNKGLDFSVDQSSVVERFDEISRRMKECDENGHKSERIIGPAGGRYNPEVTVRCDYCLTIYDRRRMDGEGSSSADLYDEII